jgi:hypothetical protein
MMKDGNGRPTGELYDDDTDPVYKDLVEKASKNRTHAQLIAGIGIEVAGKDLDEKWANLAQRITPGDWLAILNGINQLSNNIGQAVEQAKNS